MSLKSFFQKFCKRQSNILKEVKLVTNDIQGSINYCYTQLRKTKTGELVLLDNDVAKALWMSKESLYKIVDNINFEIKFKYFVLYNAQQISKTPYPQINDLKTFHEGKSGNELTDDAYLFTADNLLILYIYLIEHVREGNYLQNSNRVTTAYYLKELVIANQTYQKSKVC